MLLFCGFIILVFVIVVLFGCPRLHAEIFKPHGAVRSEETGGYTAYRTYPCQRQDRGEVYVDHGRELLGRIIEGASLPDASPDVVDQNV